MNKKAYIIPEITVIKMETLQMIAFSDADPSNSSGGPIVDPTPDDTDEPIRSREFSDWNDEEDW